VEGLIWTAAAAAAATSDHFQKFKAASSYQAGWQHYKCVLQHLWLGGLKDVIFLFGMCIQCEGLQTAAA